MARQGNHIMVKAKTITTVFIDIGGVLLTNGWDHLSRKLAAKKYKLDFDEMETRHQLIFSTYELGKLDLKNYLDYVVFYQKRKFTPAQFKKFMLDQSQPYPEMLELIHQLKIKYNLKIAVVSNESRELNSYRVQKFKLGDFVDFFASSCIVQLRKPDPEIYRLALDIAQVPANQVVYIDDRPLFVDIAKNLDMRGIHHTDYKSTYHQLALLGLSL